MIKTFVINLERRKDRLEIFKKNWDWLIKYNVFKAVDSEDLDLYNYGICQNWLDPLLHRPLTTGEIGCFLSHYSLWNICKQLDRPILVLEDDIYPVIPNNISKAIEKAEITINSGNADLVYLGYKEMSRSYSFDEDFLIPGYPYLTSSYLITPRACNLLLQTDIINSIIPVDEFLALMVGGTIPVDFHSKGLKEMSDRLERFEKIKSLAFRINQIEQAPREMLGSDVEPSSQSENSFPERPNLYTFSFATERDKASVLENSAVKNGFNIYILGTKDEWTGGDLRNGTGGMQKIKTLYSFLKQNSDGLGYDDIILFMDGYDTFVNTTPDEVYKRFMQSEKDLLFASELYCWPNKNLEILWNEITPEKSNKYLNSGLFIAKFGPLMEILRESDKYSNSYDDQLFFHRVFLKSRGFLENDEMPVFNYEFHIDYDNEIFQCLNGEKENLLVGMRGVVLNTNTNKRPIIFHGNGPDETKKFFQEFVDLVKTRTQLSIPAESQNNAGGSDDWSKYFKFAVKHQHPIGQNDIIALEFLTEHACKEIIERAESFGAWNPEPGDAYPGQEQRLSRFWPEMFNAINAYLSEYVYHHFERHWSPMVIPGLRDIFVIKYSIDGQKSLDLHHDASLVSMSIKLNEDYEGGELYFPRQDFSNRIIPVGTALAWPSQVTHPHECKTLTGGTKYSLTIWTARLPEEVIKQG